MARRTRNNGTDSRNLLGRAEHPRNVFARIQQLEAGQGVQFGGVYGGGDPTQYMPNPVPVVVSATPTVTYVPPPGRQRHALALRAVIAYDPPEDFVGLQAHIYALSGHQGFDHVTQPRTDTTQVWVLEDIGFVLGATYAMEVRAITERGVGRWSDPYSPIFFNVSLSYPNPPRNLAINTAVGVSGWGWDPEGAWVALQWDPPLYPEGTRDPDEYLLVVTLQSPPVGADALVYTIPIPGGSDGYVLRGLVVDPPTAYTLALYASEGGMRSATAATLNITTQYTGLVAPTFPAPYYTFGTEPDTDAEGWVRFDWNAVTNATGYVVEGSTDGGTTSYDVPGSPTEATDIVEHKIPLGTTRHYRVAALDNRGRSGVWSDWKACALNVRTPIAEPPPTGWDAYNPADEDLRGLEVVVGAATNIDFVTSGQFEGRTEAKITSASPHANTNYAYRGPLIKLSGGETIVVGASRRRSSGTGTAPHTSLKWQSYQESGATTGAEVTIFSAEATTSNVYTEVDITVPADARWGRWMIQQHDASGTQSAEFSSFFSYPATKRQVKTVQIAPGAVTTPKIGAYEVAAGKSNMGLANVENGSLEDPNDANTMAEGWEATSGTVQYLDTDVVGGQAPDGKRYLLLGGASGTHRVRSSQFMAAKGRFAALRLRAYAMLSSVTNVSAAGIGFEFYDKDRAFISRAYAWAQFTGAAPTLSDLAAGGIHDLYYPNGSLPAATVYAAVFADIVETGTATLKVDAFVVGEAGDTIRPQLIQGAHLDGSGAGPYIQFSTDSAGMSGNWSTAVLKMLTASKTANFTADTSATTYLCDPSGGAPGSSFTATLPSPSSAIAGRIYVFQKTDTGANKVYVNGTGISNYPLVLPAQSVTVQCNASTWRIIATSVLALERDSANSVWVSERVYRSLYTADASWTTFSASSAPHRRRAAPSPHKWLCEALRWSFRPNGTNTLGNTWTLQNFTESNTLGGTGQGSMTVVGYAGSTWHTADVVPSSPVWDFSSSSYYTIGWEVVKSGSAGDLDVMDVQAILRRVYD